MIDIPSICERKKPEKMIDHIEAEEKFNSNRNNNQRPAPVKHRPWNDRSSHARNQFDTNCMDDFKVRGMKRHIIQNNNT